MPEQLVMVQARPSDGLKLAPFLGQNDWNRPLRKPMQLRSLLLTAALGLGGMAAVPAQAETSIQISLKERYLTLLDDGRVIGKYPVAIGAPESPTLRAAMR